MEKNKKMVTDPGVIKDLVRKHLTALRADLGALPASISVEAEVDTSSKKFHVLISCYESTEALEPLWKEDLDV